MKHADARPCSDTSTEVPDDEEYLPEWGEWSEIEKGCGPKASWNGDVWNTVSGVISRSTMASPGKLTMIKNGKSVTIENEKNKFTIDDDDLVAFPTMPCTSAPNNIHRTKVPPEGLGGNSSIRWYQGQLEEPRLSQTPKPKNLC